MMGLATTAQANFLNDALDAVQGHTNDLIERFSHEDKYIAGTSLGSGKFRDDDVGRDFAHWANGTASLVQSQGNTFIQLGEDFATGPAPDLYLYIADAKVVDETSFWAASRVEVAKLESGSGAQFYELPVDFEAEDHIELIVWCKRFGAFIGATTLK